MCAPLRLWSLLQDDAPPLLEGRLELANIAARASASSVSIFACAATMQVESQDQRVLPSGRELAPLDQDAATKASSSCADSATIACST